MTRKEAIDKVYGMSGTKEQHEALEFLVPEIRELREFYERQQEDERIRKWIYNLIENLGVPADEEAEKELNEMQPRALAWLEKQKDASKAIEAVDRIDKYIDEHLANAHDMKDSNPDKKYYRGWDDALGKMAGILQDVYSGEKQKEQKHVEQKVSRAEIHQELFQNGTITMEEYLKLTEKTQKGQKPVEWDRFDEDCLRRAIWYVENPAPSVVKDTNLALWLKSLPERFNLKPKQECGEKGTKGPQEIGDWRGDEGVCKKQKEPHYTKRNALFDKCVENCDPEVMKEVSDEIDEMLGKEQKPKNELPDYDININDLEEFPEELLKHYNELLIDAGEIGRKVGEIVSASLKKHYILGLQAGKKESNEQKEQKPEEKPINWTELTWKDIDKLEGIINNVHYEFRNGIGQESFGKEVLERFREYKGDEYLDEIEQKPAESNMDLDSFVKWFEEQAKTYEINLPNRYYDIYAFCKDIFNHLQKPVEWSEEDEKMIDTIVSILGQYIDYKTVSGTDSGYTTPRYSKEIDWLKSLRPSWKPSEHQMNILKAVKDYVGKGSEYWGEGLGSLIDNLEKLM